MNRVYRALLVVLVGGLVAGLVLVRHTDDHTAKPLPSATATATAVAPNAIPTVTMTRLPTMRLRRPWPGSASEAG